MSTVATDLTNCLNCGADLHGAYCAECGQAAVEPNPTFHDFFHEVSHELFHVDGRLWQSVRLLFMKPGFLTIEHREGRRARHVAPMRLYLTFSVIFFIIAVYAPLEMKVRMDPKRGRVLTTGGIDISGDVLKGRTDLEVAEWIHKIEHEWMPRVMFVMVPVYAGLVGLVTRRQRRRFPQHLYFAVHAHAAWFGILTLAELTRFWQRPIVSQGSAYAAVAAIAVYTAVALHRVYGGGWIRTAVRTIATLFAYVSLMIVATVVLFIVLYSVEFGKSRAGKDASAANVGAAFRRPAQSAQCASAGAGVSRCGASRRNSPFQPSSNTV
jgi:hypothetical protein